MTNGRHSRPRDTSFPVAVIGLHGRFPGASDAQTFWENLRDGRDVITTIPPERWDHATFFGEPEGTEERTYATTGGFMRDVDCFDCGFFNILPREAESMDPQQRLFLQTAWQALEDAGRSPKDLAGKEVGVFVGVGHADYPVLMRRDGAPFDVFRATGIVPTAIANRVSFSLDLRGPSESIDTACSGSLVAIHRAVQSLESGECDLAIAGGVNLLLGPELFIAFAKAGMLSRSGRCRVLDADCDGYVRGESVAAIILRPLDQAEADGDFIYGVIRGTAENHGGKTHSFTAPGVSGQAHVVTHAWTRAGRSFQDASLLEMHGTGTPLGDPIELKGLKRALDDTSRGSHLADESVKKIALGALKSHVGHLEAAAGIGGVIKTLLSIQNGLIPPNLHFRCLNPQINLDGTPFFVPVTPVPLGTDSERPPLAGVSSFGFGGVNAHVVVEGYRRVEAGPPRSTHAGDEATPYLFVISARDERALSRRVAQLLTFLDQTGTQEPLSEQANIRRIEDALGLGSLAGECGGIRLDSLDLSESQLILALERLSFEAATPVLVRDIRDCVTIRDLAERIDAISGGTVNAVSVQSGGEASLPRVAVTSETLRNANLATISHSLMHGRDAMHERLAIVTGCKAALMTTLRGFLKDPRAPQRGLARGSILSSQNTPAPEPIPREGAAIQVNLEEWARYWISNRHPKLHWKDLHRRSAPRKIPLPAYPFELKRVWYTAPDRLIPAAVLPATTSIERASAEFHAPVRIDRSITTSRSPSIPLPATLAGLAFLLQHLMATHGNRAIHLSHIEFGQPLESKEGKMSWRNGERGQKEIVQCLYGSDPAPHVLVQARLTSAIVVAPHSSHGFPDDMLIVQPLTLYSDAERVGVKIAPEYRCIEAAHATTNALSLKIRLPRVTGEPLSYGPSLLASVLTGSVCLHERAAIPYLDTKVLCFYRANALAFDPRGASEDTEIAIERSEADGSMHVIARDSDGRRILELCGLQIRKVPKHEHKVVPTTSTAARTALAS